MRGSIAAGDVNFPPSLKIAAPDVKELYYEGRLDLLRGPCIAVVGSRECTGYGRAVAKNIGKRVAESGAVLVSGLAKGIDGAAHTGALEGGGSTVAVLGNGLDIYYPRENVNLQKNIAKAGLLISEYPGGTKPKPFHFPLRNRIISGISDSVVIVEAGQSSGALITAERAAEQGKRIYAVPGNITSLYSFGTNMLIRENVTPLILVDDVLIDLGIKPKGTASPKGLGKEEILIYEALRQNGEMTVEDIYHKTNIKPSELSGIMTILEMKGIIFSSLGKFFIAKF